MAACRTIRLTRLVAALLALAAVALVHPSGARAKIASVVPTKLLFSYHFNARTTTIESLAVVNLYPGAVVTLTLGPSEEIPFEAELLPVTVPASGVVDLTKRVRPCSTVNGRTSCGLKFKANSYVSLTTRYVPPNTSGEEYVRHTRILLQRPAAKVVRDCTETFAGQTTPECKLPCPAPAGISVPYCRGAGRTLRFQAVDSFISLPRAVRLTRLDVAVRTPGSSLSVLCLSRRNAPCPFALKVYPVRERRRIEITALRRRRLGLGVRVYLAIYKGNYTGQVVIFKVVRSRGKTVIRLTQRCFYPEDVEVTRCT